MAKINISFLSKSLICLLAIIGVLMTSFLTTSAQSVNQGYNADEPLQLGMIVVVKDGDQTRVEKANKDTIDKIKGVVVQQNDSPVTLANTGQNVFVATNGIYDTLVSDENGQIKAGDYVSISSLAGIGMKATDEQNIIVGRAAADFDGESGRIGTSEDPKTKKTS